MLNMIVLILFTMVSIGLGYQLFRRWNKHHNVLLTAQYWFPRDYARAEQYAKHNCVSLCRESHEDAMKAKTIVEFTPQPFLYTLAVKILGYTSKQSVVDIYTATLKNDTVELYLKNH
jgi:hypothetical protein